LVPGAVEQDRSQTHGLHRQEDGYLGATNRIVGGPPPAKNLAALERRGGIAPETLDRILATHLISTEALRAADFEAFFEARQKALIELIRTARGKAAVASAEDWIEPAGEPIEGEDDSDDEMEALAP
jgi:hypothetical protein